MTDLNDNALTTLANVKEELGLTTTGSDDYLKKQINFYSDLFEEYTEKKWYKKSGHVENIQSFGDKRLQVSDHLPIESISEIKFYDEDPVPASDYEIEDADIGWIRFKNGTFDSTVVQKRRVDFYEHTYEYKAKVTYTGGYVTPYQATTGSYSGSAVTLPSNIQQGIIQTISNKFRMKGSPSNITGESLGEASVDFHSPSDMNKVGGMSVSDGLAFAINKYKKRRVY